MGSKSLNSRVTAQRFSVIRDMVARAKAYDDVISLSIGEPDFDTPAFVCEAAMRDAMKGFTHYAPSHGDEDLRAALLQEIRRKTGIPYGDENLLITTGAMHGLLAVMLTLLSEGDEVICPAPCFSDYQGHCGLAGATLVMVPTKFSEGFIPSREDLQACLTPHTKALLINSPCNPSGIVLPPETLDMMAEFALEHDLIVISDEVYDRITFSAPIESISTRPGMSDRTVILNSFSKAYAMTGWRVGFAVGPAWIMREMIKVLSYSIASTNSPGQRAAFHAMTGPQDEFLAFVDAYRRRTDLAYRRLIAMPDVQCIKPAGTFYLFPHIAAAEKDSFAFAVDLLDKEHVVVVPGFPFGPDQTVRGCIRLACTVSEEKIAEAMDRLKHYLTRRS